ncbi:P44/Msp2 family outer membrane protein [Candidatus Neoehrlichia procyonis]|uniref:Surface antigen family protein n=1 Tax=Candidatus Neoehrlichia procyonis str. RAC413 TaxID=1359163 RepID=A0A0F3NNX6_9RICK|nr:P44/Msp2 family outer membrane protein [Candidatus Neoehrlichia lotoris]KJV69407.1 surface antigen family protein [Candidatus Neoehrlichia lotoris str. RAC413]
MSLKKKFVKVTFLTLVVYLVPAYCFADNNLSTNKNLTKFYISGQYKASISDFKNFSINEEGRIGYAMSFNKNANSNELKESSNFNALYKCDYNNNYNGLSGAIGVLNNNNVRVELEFSHQLFDVTKIDGHKYNDYYRYLAISRDKNVNNGKYFVLKNKGVEVNSLIVNNCYGLSGEVIVPYLCFGAGVDFINLFDAVRPKIAFQGKLGVSIPLAKKLFLVIDSYYHKVVSDEFHNISVDYPVILTEEPKATSAVAKLNIKYFGGAVGIRTILF